MEGTTVVETAASVWGRDQSHFNIGLFYIY